MDAQHFFLLLMLHELTLYLSVSSAVSHDTILCVYWTWVVNMLKRDYLKDILKD